MPTENENKEVRQSWTLKYIVLAIVISILSGISGYGLKYLFERKEREFERREREKKRFFSFWEEGERNLLLGSNLADKISVNYSLKETNESLKSYFQYTVRFRNEADEAAENIKFTLEAKDSEGEEIILVKQPLITSEPRQILTGLGLKQNEELDAPDTDKWTISLLNPGEIVRFSYTAYCTKKRIEKLNFNPVIRKGNWTVKDQSDREGIKGTRTLSTESYALRYLLEKQHSQELLQLLLMVMMPVVVVCVLLLVRVLVKSKRGKSDTVQL